ncbi:MAG TPA: hypothetical protein VFS43_30525 [Polyangiaceae bacterium]|nr:hypothetical protein [Polyangiaceae bacterium]
MGVHVILDIDPRGIDKRAWARAYDETLTLLRAWRPRLLGWGWRTIEGVQVPMYRHEIERVGDAPRQRCWAVVGDQESLQTAECQSLYRTLDHYALPEGEPDDDDIVAAAAAPSRDDTGGARRVFGDKTQGCPYHFAVLAAAMLVEERFPRRAMVWGDIDRGQAEEARRLAAPLLGRELPLPVRVDAERLADRLRVRYGADALPGAFERVFLGDPNEVHEIVLRAFPGEHGARQWLRSLNEYRSPGSIGTVNLLIAWLNAGRELGEACRLACVDAEGPRYAPEAFVDALASTWVAVARSARGPLDPFRKPPGEAPTVASLLGSFLLDMGTSGRRLRVELGPDAIARALRATFGDGGPALAARLHEKSAALEGELRRHADDVKRFVERASQQAGDDTEALATLHPVDSMGENQRAWVRATAWGVMQALARLRADPAMAAQLSDAPKAKGALVRVLTRRPLTLTEDAWDAITSENDADVLAWYVALASMGADELRAYQVRRALFENAELRQYAITLGRDRREMREVGKLIASASGDRGPRGVSE